MPTLNGKSAAPRGLQRTKALLVAAVMAVLIATLWPFDPFARNGVTWLQGARGLQFENAGVVVSNAYLKPGKTQAAESYSLELLLRPANRQSGTILAFYNEARPTQLLIGQDGERLSVTHDAAVRSERTRTTEFHADHVLRPGRLALVTISSGPSGTVVYLDGETAASLPGFRLSRTELSGQIVLGTSPSIYEPWAGELRGLAIYAKELTIRDVLGHEREWMNPGAPLDKDGAIAHYAFAEAAGREIRDDVAAGPSLEVPAIFSVPHKAFLRSAKKEFGANWTYAKDVAVNIAGFVPLGLIACAYLSWTRSCSKAMVTATVACGVLSFVIEVLQYYLPRRFSGTTDIITNTVGAALGAAIMQASAVRRVLQELKMVRSQRSAA